MMANRKWQRDINTVAGGWGGLTGQCVLQPTEAHRLTLAVKVRWMILKKKKKCNVRICCNLSHNLGLGKSKKSKGFRKDHLNHLIRLLAGIAKSPVASTPIKAEALSQTAASGFAGHKLLLQT